MANKLLVTTHHIQDFDRVRATGAEVLAEYPDALLVRVSDEQAGELDQAGLETTPLPSVPVRTANASFDFAEAVAAEAETPMAVNPDRTGYYLVQLVGPVMEGWLSAMAALGAVVHASLSGYRLLVGILPRQLAALAAEPFVEEVTPFRPAMKLSPALRGDSTPRMLSRQDLARVEVTAVARPDTTRPEAVDTGRAQVEIAVFDGEDIEELATSVRARGGTVLLTGVRTIAAEVPSAALPDLADEPAVASILPHAFEELTNDRAIAIMGIPADRVIGRAALSGAGQVIGVADSGIDTGDEATLHADLRGRVTIVSLPSQITGHVISPVPSDDGAADQNGHGTHVAGSIIGNGAAAAGQTIPRGVAYEARLHFTAVGQRITWDPEYVAHAPEPPKPYGLYGLPGDLAGMFGNAYEAGARIYTNSWGNAQKENFGDYNRRSSQVDAFMFTHRDMLIVFAAGNSGLDTDGDGRIDEGSINPPATAKNCLTVGATENDRPAPSIPSPGVDRPWSLDERYAAFAAAGHVSDNPDGVALFSSRGPTRDGRLKPEVVAPGTNVLSVRSTAHDAGYIGAAEGAPPLWGEVRPRTHPLHGLYCWSGGTSMAAPLVAGVVALIRQYLVEQRGCIEDGARPSGALLKAFVVNGAVPIAGQYPGEIPSERQNNVSGFGRVHLDQSLEQSAFVDDPAFALASGQAFRWRIPVTGASKPLKVTLTWTDPPSPVGFGGTQNVLYLRVIPPGGTALDGDVVPFGVAVRDSQANNTQQVVITDPVPGTYELRVHAIHVAIPSAGAGAPPGVVQDFALVVSGAAVR